MGLSIDLEAPFEPERGFSCHTSQVWGLQNLVIVYLEQGVRGCRFPLLMRYRSGAEARYELSEVPSFLGELCQLRSDLEALWVPALEVSREGETSIELIRLNEAGEPLPLYDFGSWIVAVNRESEIVVTLPAEERELLTREIRPGVRSVRTAAGDLLPLPHNRFPQLPDARFSFGVTSAQPLEQLDPLLAGITRICELALTERHGVRIG
ncbi:MAG: hypothetical protein AAF657_02485 [Acidobacteriota bacterium]